jgi:hypothetical protein
MRLLLFVCVLGGCKDITSTIVGGTIGTSKEIVSGVKEGVEEGRKQGESLDGAVIVTTAEELRANGAVTVYAVRAGVEGAELVLAFENKGERPMRVGGLEIMALDPDGFVLRPLKSPEELTVPAMAKDQLVVTVPGAPERVAKVRVWGEELAVPAPTVPPAPAPAGN